MPEQEIAATSPRAGSREWIGLAVLALPALLVALDIGVLFLALPHLSADLGATGTQQLWITDSYGFLLAGFLVTMGSLGDRIGRRRLLLIGAAAFGAASVLAAYSTTPTMLIVARGLLGVAGATLGPSTLALISTMFADARQRGVAIAVWGTCQFGGAALGPVIGGAMLSHFWWGSAFLLGVPVMVVLLVVGPLLLPEFRTPATGRIDLPSVTLSLSAVLPVVYGIKELAAGGGSSPVTALGAILAGLACGVLFIRRQRRLTDPLVDLRLFTERPLLVALTAMAVGSATLAGVSLLTSQFVQSVGGIAPAAAGLWQAPTGVGIAVGVLLSPTLVKAVRPVTAIAGGLLGSTLGLLALTLVDPHDGPGFVAFCVAVVACGVGPLFALGTGLVVGSAPVSKAGSAASLSETGNVLGSTLGLALFGTLATAVYRGRFAGQVSPDVPQAAAGAAGETIGGAVSAAGSLPGEQASALLDTAAEVFTDGLHLVAVTGAVLLACLVIAVRATLRERPAAAPPR